MTAICKSMAAWLHARLGFCLLAASSLFIIDHAGASALSDALRSPDQVLLMRHADAPGFGDPPGYLLGDCSTQRNLGDRGKRQAARTGAWLRSQGVGSARVFSSPWCRGIDTAKLLNFGEVTIEQSLGSFFSDPNRSGEQTALLEKFVAGALARKGTSALILVTHQVNITAYVGESTGSGDMVLARVDRAGKVVEYSFYPSPLP